MTSEVIDENVLRTANGEATHCSADCQLAAIEALLECQERRSLVLDDAFEILSLYGQSCSHAGQPGVGDEFFVWARDMAPTLRRVTLQRCETGFYAFPTDSRLQTFDPSDRIYVAAAMSCLPPATLINAVDSDYAHHEVALSDAGLSVRELCPAELKRPGRKSATHAG